MWIIHHSIRLCGDEYLGIVGAVFHGPCLLLLKQWKERWRYLFLVSGIVQRSIGKLERVKAKFKRNPSLRVLVVNQARQRPFISLFSAQTGRHLHATLHLPTFSFSIPDLL